MPFLPNLRGSAGVAALLLLQLATPCWCDWVYSPNSYFHLQVDTCQTRACEDGPFHGFEQGTGKHTSTLLGVRPRIRGGTEAMAGARRRRGGLSRPRAGIPHFESKREVEAHLSSALRGTGDDACQA